MSKWSMPPDARKSGLKYPNFNKFQTPSGSGYIFDDTKEHESVTFFHRSGTTIQFQPDGSIVYNHAGNSYNITFGDNNMMITKNHNMTVNGNQETLIEGDADSTIRGSKHDAVEGDHDEAITGNKTSVVSGSQETVVGENQSTKVGGNSEMLAKKVFVGGESGVGVNGGPVVDIKGTNITSEGDMSHNGNISVSGDLDVSGDLQVSGSVVVGGDLTVSGTIFGVLA